MLPSPDGSLVPIHYTLARSSRRSYSIEISAEGVITMRVPNRTSEKAINDILMERASWILIHEKKQKDKAKKRQEEKPKLSEEERERTRKLAAERIKPILQERIAYYEPMLPKTHRPLRTVTIRAQKTRWGSCSAKGGLNFNVKLYFAPPEALDYVVVHELCHLCEMNHGPRFWALVAQIMPDYQVWRKWLRDNGSSLEL